MLVVGLVGSPRKNMNTDTIVQRILDGCHDSGAEVARIYLNDLNIQTCQACKVQDGAGCVQHDDMDRIYDIFEAADGLILGTPVYYNTVSSQMKLMIDRSYCLAKPVILPSGRRVYQSSVQKQKRGVVVSVGGSGSNPECVLPVFHIWSAEVNLAIVGSILTTHAQLGMAPMECPEIMRVAYSKGTELVHSLERDR